jgi:hypothetical protein
MASEVSHLTLILDDTGGRSMKTLLLLRRHKTWTTLRLIDHIWTPDHLVTVVSSEGPVDAPFAPQEGRLYRVSDVQ